MANRAYIKLVKQSKQETISLNELKDIFHYYKNITSKTGTQLDWSYGEAAFPYEIYPFPGNEDNYFYLKSSISRYNYIVFGIGEEIIRNQENEEEKRTYIEIILPEGSTHGDKGKANEFCKFLSKKLEGELHLFNGRVMYYYKRK